MEQRDYGLEFNSIIKNVVAPIFKDLGFKKKGNNFYRDLGGFGQAFNIQQSKWNSRDDKSFVFNIGLLYKFIYNQTHSLDIPKFPQEVDCDIRLRINDLKADATVWYDLNKGVELSSLSEKIQKEIKLYFVPFFEKYKDFNNWGELLNLTFKCIYNPICEFLLIEKFQGLNQAKIFLNRLYNKALIPRTPSDELSKKNLQVMKDTEKRWVDEIVDMANKKNIELVIAPIPMHKNSIQNNFKGEEKLYDKFLYYLKSLWS